MRFERVGDSFEVGFGSRLWRVKVQRIHPGRYEVQDTDEKGYLVWFSGGPNAFDWGSILAGQLPKRDAIRLAEERPLPAGHSRVVKHVATGEVVWRRKP